MRTAIFWIANGTFKDEAARSATSYFLASMDNKCHSFLFTPDADAAGPFTEVIQLPQPQHKLWFLNSTLYFIMALQELRALEFEAAIYLDTDTHVCASLAPLVQLADKIDFAGAFAPGRHTRNTIEPVPCAFPEFNVGVNLFALNAPTVQTVIDWYELYKKHADEYGNNDQASLREVMYANKRGIRIAVLPPEFNFRFGFGGFLRGECRVLHGRSNDIEKVARTVNATNDFRTFQRSEL